MLFAGNKMLFYILTLVYSTPFDINCKMKCKKVKKLDRKITIAEFFYKSLAGGADWPHRLWCEY